MMNNIILSSKGMLFGIIGAFIGAFPNIIVKTLLAFSSFGDFCFNLPNVEIREQLVITPCGLVSFVGYSFWATFLPVIVGGALFGFIGMRMGYKKAKKKEHNLVFENWKGSFRWSFIGGVLFDLIFMCMIFWPGY